MSRPRHTLGISKLRRSELVGGPYISLIAKHEAMCKCLYQTFAIAYPSMSTFWNHLAAEEEQHFRLIEALDADIRNSEVMFKRPAFTQAHIRDSIAWICARKERVQAGGVTINEALAMCIQIEQGMVEHRFFDVMDADHEKVRHTLMQLEKASIIHLKRARQEAKRLKWKFFGGKTNKPIPEERIIDTPLETQTDSKVAVKVAQAAILAALINLEEAAASLYNTYAELLPEHAKMWSSLSAEEMTHATMLHQLEDMLEKGNVFRNMGQFGVSGLRRVMDEILNAEAKAQRDGITYTEAMIVALRTESHMAECEFYKTVESDVPEFKYIADRLVALTEQHIQRLSDATAPMSTTPKKLGGEKKQGGEKVVEWFG